MNTSLREAKQRICNNLFELESMISIRMAALKCPFRMAPPQIHDRFDQLTVSSLESIGVNLKRFLDTLVMAEENGVDAWNDHEFLAISMSYAGLTFPRDFYSHTRADHVVEAYDMNRHQIYRNLHFMEVSNYSLLEVLAYDWPTLFHRDLAVTNLIIQQAEQDMWSENRTIPSKIPVHYIRELLSKEPQICEVQQQYFAPLYSGPNKPGGILVASSAKPMGVEVRHENVSFLNQVY